MFFFAVEHVEGFEAFKQLFENNLINWLVLVAAIVYLWNKNVPPMFKAREEHIESAIKDAALVKKQGEDLLEEQKKRIANAEAEAQKILSEAKALAVQLGQQMEAQAKQDRADLETKIKQQMENERRLAVTQMRQTAAAAAIKLTEQLLPSLLDEQSKAKLLDQFMEQLDTISTSGQTFTAGNLETSNK